MASASVVLPAPEAPNSATTPSGFGAEGRVQREFAAGESRLDRQHYPSSRRLTMRARNSEPISAAKAMTMAITMRRKAPSRPPGTWV